MFSIEKLLSRQQVEVTVVLLMYEPLSDTLDG